MHEFSTIGVDLAKNVFQLRGGDDAGKPILRRKLQRSQMLGFFRRPPGCLVGMEVCASAHYRARELIELGHEVRLMQPSYVKGYVKRGKTDKADAEAICTNSSCGNMARCWEHATNAASARDRYRNRCASVPGAAKSGTGTPAAPASQPNATVATAA